MVTPYVHQLVAGLFKILSAFLLEVALQENRIPRVAFVHSIGQVANEGDQTNHEIEYDVKEHVHADIAWKSAFDFVGACNDHER